MIIINGQEMEVVGVKGGRLLCEYKATHYKGSKFEYEATRKPTFKIYKTKKGLYIRSGKRLYVDDEIRRCLYQILGPDFIASMLTTAELTHFLSKRGGVEEYYGSFEENMKLSIENADGKIEEHKLVTPATVLHVYD